MAKSKSWFRKNHVLTFITVLIIIGFVLSLSSCSATSEKSEALPTKTKVTTAQPTSDYSAELVRDYEIVEIEDISMKAMDKPLSAYSLSEIEKLPTNIRKRYRVVVPSDISKAEFRATLIKLIMDETKKDPDIDEIAVLVYDRKVDANSVYTFGKVDWCPNGEWADVTTKIASTNDRSSYEYVFDIKDKVGNINSEDKPTEREFEIYDAFEEALWEDPNVPEEEVEERVAEELGLSKEELNRVYLKVLIYQMN